MLLSKLMTEVVCSCNKIIASMKKRQAEEYFQQLKRVDRDRDIKLAQLINILTGGAITVREFYQFKDYLKGNEFGEYNHIDEDIDRKDWRQMQFNTVYQLLKAIKDFIINHRSAKNEQTSLAASSNKQTPNEAQSPKENNTVLSLLNNLAQNEPASIPDQHDERRYFQKWKSYKLRVFKKLLIIFDYYRKSMCVTDETFEHNHSLTQKFDITTFMRYIKDFELSPAFELQRVIRVFKANAVNTLWLDFDRFVNTHLHLIGFKEGLSHQEKYLKLRGFNELLSSQKMKRMLNVRRQHITAVVEGHTGAYKQDIIKHLQQKAQERKEKISKKWSGKSVKTQGSQSERANQNLSISAKGKHSSMKRLQRAKTQATPSVYEQLKLPKLRLKQHREQSVYQSLNMLELSREQQKIREMVGMEDSGYLQQYLQEERRLKDRRSRSKREVQLPRMKFT